MRVLALVLLLLLSFGTSWAATRIAADAFRGSRELGPPNAPSAPSPMPPDAAVDADQSTDCPNTADDGAAGAWDGFFPELASPSTKKGTPASAPDASELLR